MEYLVIEVIERDIKSVHVCGSRDDAIDKANELLLAHFEAIGYNCDDGDEYNDSQKATPGSLCAWSNLEDENWDAHVVSVKN